MVRAPLAVRINDGYTDRHVTRYVEGLRFTKTAPGGFHSLSMRLNLPRDTFGDLGPADKVYVYDARTGRVVFEGFTENPGALDGPAGQSFELAAMGNLILAQDESRSLVYIDRDLGAWEQFRGAAAAVNATASVSDDPSVAVDAVTGILTHHPQGPPVATNSVAQMGYQVLEDASMEFGALLVTTKSGKDDTGYRTNLAYSDGFTSSSIFIGNGSTITTVPVVDQARYVGEVGHPPVGQTRIALQLRRTGGATNVVDDETWSHFSDIAVLGRRMDRHGVLVTGLAGMQTAAYVRADWVVEDLLGRVLTMCDPETAVVDTTAAMIDQLTFAEGATAANVLDALTLYEPDFVWELLHSTDGGVVFRYRAWATEPRYEVSVRDGYSAPGGEADLCNRIAVYWTDEKRASRTTIVTSTVPALGTRVRDAPAVTLPVGQGSETNALLLGAQILATKAAPPKAAKVTIRRPIFDRLTGRDAMPWEIEAGYPARVVETGDVLRITEFEYDDDAVAADLTLGEPILTIEQRIVRLTRAAA